MIGYLFLSSTTLNDSPAIQIDYIFVDYEYRKKSLDEIGKISISKYLILHAIKITKEIKELIGVKYLTLYPDKENQKLIERYREFGFILLKNSWLFVKI